MDKTIDVTGEITYNGRPRAELLPRLPRFVGYTNQKYDHQPQLTVQETFEFAHECCEGSEPEPWIVKAMKELAGERHENAVKVMTALHKFAADLRIRTLGLTRCKDTMVGNAMIRGVSGANESASRLEK